MSTTASANDVAGLQANGTNTYEVTEPNVTVSLDNTDFDVQSGASLTLTGSSNTVTAESGAGGLNVDGNGNVISGANADGMQVNLNGSGNVLTMGGNGGVTDTGSGDTITIGTDSQAGLFGSQTTLDATQGGDLIYVESTSSGATINASNDRVQASQSIQLNGDGNQVGLSQSTLNLSGNNNTIGVGTGSEVVTSNGSLTEAADGSFVGTGNVNAGAVSLTGGVATVQLGNGNIATIGNVAAGTTFDYVDASGTTSSITLMDSDLQHVGGSLYDVTGPVTALMSNTIFDVQSGASLNLTGSSNTVIAESGAGGLNVNGTGNTISGANADGMQVDLNGSGNVLTMGGNGGVTDTGSGDTITIGTDSQAGLFGSQTTLDATQGGDLIYVESTSSGATINASNDRVQASQSIQLNGDGNQVGLSQSTLNLSGNNNTIGVGTGSEVVTSNGSLTEAADGSFVGTGNVNAGAVSLTGGVATVQLGNGNIATIDNVASGTTFDYVDASGATSAFTLVDTDLQHVGGSLYDVTGPVTALMSNTIFDVQSGASLNLTGSSNTVIAESGVGGLNVNGSGNVITGTSTNGMQVGLSGSGNVLTAGTNGGVTDTGAGDTITIGTNSQAGLFGSQTTLNAKQGGDLIYVESTSSGATVNASNDRVQAWQSFQLNGNGNEVGVSQSTLNLSGNNNTVGVGTGSEIVTSNGSLTDAANGTLVGTGNVDVSAVSLSGGVATVQLGNGNVATIGNVAAGTTFEHVDASGNGTWTVLQDSGLSSSVSATFDFGTGGGQQTINAVTGATGSEAGVVDFAPGITDNQLWFEQVGNNLQVDIIGTRDSLTVNGWFADAAAAQQFHTADGLMADSQVNQLVAAMASYSSANPGFNPATATGMPSDSTLQGAIASAWHH
ncbi:beta strand repeat-containing protein [Burkholderia lata]|uniref:Bifunctional hemolysin/adenylate cyclase n=1 Tax=Burkholderia lata (strain ATCC 17760 / DSM 23089 / LMG 22485 / NCIMB 9086 / R18194 / 383) TaxID=482957 RepID=A0A6P2TKM4_BURL3|nr:S-layer family protein [Burkholderia lata]VWC56945.1 Bifunctional hemolysin/adenylate cyclase [Burkholderia lata]